jgi:hypothetical protein
MLADSFANDGNFGGSFDMDSCSILEIGCNLADGIVTASDVHDVLDIGSLGHELMRAAVQNHKSLHNE